MSNKWQTTAIKMAAATINQLFTFLVFSSLKIICTMKSDVRNQSTSFPAMLPPNTSSLTGVKT